ncbi:MAG TPA: universal stress protein [Candidatus Limnocylindria bacterium]|nr:universal stress protein [Candidatus Limnocylindria bacterium]
MPIKVVLASDDSTPARAAEAWLTNARWASPPQFTVLTVGAPLIAARSWLHGTRHGSLMRALAELEADEEEAARRIADSVARRMRVAGLSVEAKARQGDAATQILREQEERAADLIALGPRGRSDFSTALLGSVSQQVLAHSRVPVLVARSARLPPGPLPQVVLVLTDGSLQVQTVMAWLESSGWLHGTQLVLGGLLGLSPGLGGAPDLEEELTTELRLAARDVLHELADRARPLARDVVIDLRLGHPLQAGFELADDHRADLLVVARRPVRPGEHPLADKVARYASTSVVLVPLSEAVTSAIEAAA